MDGDGTGRGLQREQGRKRTSTLHGTGWALPAAAWHQPDCKLGQWRPYRATRQPSALGDSPDGCVSGRVRRPPDQHQHHQPEQSGPARTREPGGSARGKRAVRLRPAAPCVSTGGTLYGRPAAHAAPQSGPRRCRGQPVSQPTTRGYTGILRVCRELESR